MAPRMDYSTIRDEFDFYNKLPSSLQNELVSLLFKPFLDLFDETFAGCERAFVSKIVTSLHY